jgi:Tfp pilus assembly protein FimT
MRNGHSVKVNNKGVTLVELLIYLGLATVMLVVLSELFVGILNESVETQNYSAVQSDGRYIMARLRYTINNADSITLPAALGDTFDELTAVAGSNQYHYYVSDDANKSLYLNDGTGDYLMSNLSTKVTELVFIRQGNVSGKAVISFSFTLSSGVSGTAQYESQTFVGAGGLR